MIRKNKKLFLPNVINFVFQEGMNSLFYKGFHSYRKSLVFLTKINKMNDIT